MISFLALSALLLFPLLLAFAAWSDLFTMRISNRLVVVLTAAFLPVGLLAGLSPADIGMHFVGGLAVLAVAFGCFALGWIGGGDAKLAAAIALWLGIENLMPFLVYSALVGGVLTLAILFARRWPLPAAVREIRWLERLHDVRTGIPYGIALAAAGLIVYARTPLFSQLAA